MGRGGLRRTPYSVACLSSLDRDTASCRSYVGRRLSCVMEQLGSEGAALTDRYHAHETLLVLFLSKKTEVPKLVDPLSRWRAWWRGLGVVLLLVNAVAMASHAWADYRCEGGPLLRDEGGCVARDVRARYAKASGTSVRLFAAGEVALGTRL